MSWIPGLTMPPPFHGYHVASFLDCVEKLGKAKAKPSHEGLLLKDSDIKALTLEEDLKAFVITTDMKAPMLRRNTKASLTLRNCWWHLPLHADASLK